MPGAPRPGGFPPLLRLYPELVGWGAELGHRRSQCGIAEFAGGCARGAVDARLALRAHVPWRVEAGGQGAGVRVWGGQAETRRKSGGPNPRGTRVHLRVALAPGDRVSGLGIGDRVSGCLGFGVWGPVLRGVPGRVDQSLAVAGLHGLDDVSRVELAAREASHGRRAVREHHPHARVLGVHGGVGAVRNEHGHALAKHLAASQGQRGRARKGEFECGWKEIQEGWSTIDPERSRDRGSKVGSRASRRKEAPC